MRPSIPAVVYPYHAASAFGIIRSLRAERIPIIGLNPGRHYVRLSNSFRAVSSPDPEVSTDDFLQFLTDLGTRIGRAVLYPTADAVAFLISRERTRLEEYFYYPYLDEPALLASFDKWRMHELASRNGIPVTPSYLIHSELDVYEAAVRLRYPAVLKPVISRFVADGSGISKINTFSKLCAKAKALRVLSTSDLTEKCRLFLSEGLQMLAQDEILGDQKDLYMINFYVDQMGELQGTMVSRKIRQMPADFGTCSFGEIADADELKGYTAAYVSASGFKGMGQMEYKRDVRDGRFKLIELNPRGVHAITLTTVNGMNFPLMQYCEFTGFRASCVRAVRRRRNWIHLEGELEYWSVYGWDRRSPYHVPFRRWFASLLSSPATEAYISWKDPLLSVVYVARALRKFLRQCLKNFLYFKLGIPVTTKDIPLKSGWP